MSGTVTTYKPGPNVLAGLAIAHGVRYAVLCPGSRNAPISLAISACGELRTQVVADERSAAFVALGMAATLQEPVMIVCTSGTALLNFGPAVAEAYYRGLPLIVVSADRPAQWIDQDDSQTLRQFEALANYVKKSFNIPDYQPDNEELAWYANREINDAFLTAEAPRKGPVHINMQLNAPLSPLCKIPAERPRVIRALRSKDILDTETVKSLAREACGRKILVVAGFFPPDSSFSRAAAAMASLPNVFFMAETIANLHAARVETGIDRTLSLMTDRELAEMRPDILITIGGALVSRQIKEYLRKYRPESHWSIGWHITTTDPMMSLSLRIEADPAHTLRRLASALLNIGGESDYRSRWEQFAVRGIESQREYIAAAPWSDLKATSLLLGAIPRNVNLHCSNGTSVRYAQLVTERPFHASFCNRGVSGIDGCTSTAAGSALAYSGTTVLLTGDMSFCYDIGILGWPGLPERLRIAVLNNSGGEIFRFIGATREMPGRETLLCADTHLDAAKIASGFGLRYYKADSESELAAAIPEWLAGDGCAILDIRTPKELNSKVLIDYMNR